MESRPKEVGERNIGRNRFYCLEGKNAYAEKEAFIS
jgi:hypothetical protein